MKKVKKMFGGGMGLPTADKIKAMSDKRRSAPGYTPGTAGLGDMPLEKLRQMQAENAPKIGTRPTPTTGGSIQGVKPTVTGAPDKNLPFVINNKPIPGMRPPGTATTGGPKPAPAVQLPVAGTRPVRPNQNPLYTGPGIKKMGMKKGGSVSSASKRSDGCAVKGKTKGKMV
jgi:hypothetical protein